MLPRRVAIRRVFAAPGMWHGAVSGGCAGRGGGEGVRSRCSSSAAPCDATAACGLRVCVWRCGDGPCCRGVWRRASAACGMWHGAVSGGCAGRGGGVLWRDRSVWRYGVHRLRLACGAVPSQVAARGAVGGRAVEVLLLSRVAYGHRICARRPHHICLWPQLGGRTNGTWCGGGEVTCSGAARLMGGGRSASRVLWGAGCGAAGSGGAGARGYRGRCHAVAGCCMAHR